MSTTATGNDDENIYVQELKTTIHYTVGKVCEEMSKVYDVQYDKQFIATLAELVYRQIGIFADDLEMFSRHAKRSVINADDVKLLVRKSESLALHIQQFHTKMSAASAKEKSRKKTKPTAAASTSAAQEN